MRSLVTALLLLAVAAPCLCQLQKGSCANVSLIDSFDIPPYLGRWYEIEKYAANFERGQTCITADYGPFNDTVITVTNTARIDDGFITAVGTGTATGLPGQLTVSFSPPSRDDDTVGLSLYNVLDTDYESVSCVYTCGEIGAYKEEYAWILSRTQTLDEDTIMAAQDLFASFGLNTTLFERTQQGGDCIYAPEPMP